MKTYKIILSIITIGAFMFASCTKDETKTVEIVKSVSDGQALIKGSVKYIDFAISASPIAAPFATIKISDNITTKAFNQFWQADSAGNFNVKGLAVGSYYIAAQYKDANNYTYTTNGFTVQVKNSVNPVTLDFICK
ncbi:MAG: hypothetical protein NTU43_05800 [Bacteroidetes bacterium]|nr:hypothetical protein [Bacteroidota bacterium]